MTAGELFTYAPLIAVGVSLLAFVVSAFSLGWNIYRDVVLKPRLSVHVGVSGIINEDGPLGPPVITLSATNLGPGPITCRLSMIKTKFSLFPSMNGASKFATVVHNYKHPLCSKLPSRLEMAEGITLLFQYDAECFLRERPTKIGIADSFGRNHWAPRREVKEAIAYYHQDFAKQNKIAAQ